MLNLYKYFDNPDKLEQKEYAPISFNYDILNDYVDKLTEMFNSGNVPEEYYYIERVFGNTERYYTHVVTYGAECAIYPLGRDKKSSYGVKLISEDGLIHGFYTHYTKETKFFEDKSEIDQESQMDEILTLGLTKLAEAELND
jgi:hypothetical protein